MATSHDLHYTNLSLKQGSAIPSLVVGTLIPNFNVFDIIKIN
jgi:hypothetical protein